MKKYALGCGGLIIILGIIALVGGCSSYNHLVGLSQGVDSQWAQVQNQYQRRENVLDAARRRFHKLGMTRTRERNAVLIYFAPLSHQFAVWGDQGVHEKCGDEFWREIVSGMTPLLKEGQFTEAIVRAIERTGEVLARHFPREPDDKNELPDRIEQD
jgi:uncharacterized membrane protein